LLARQWTAALTEGLAPPRPPLTQRLQVGPDAARRCYWDFGDWSEIWRDSRPAPLDAGLEALMGAADDVGCLRWARCAVELARGAAAMCPASVGAAVEVALWRLQRHSM
jgi:hypothetical protein